MATVLRALYRRFCFGPCFDGSWCCSTNSDGSMHELVAFVQERFCKPNAGFVYNFQFIDVPPMVGPGESCPTPYFYQNIDEAELSSKRGLSNELPATQTTFAA